MAYERYKSDTLLTKQEKLSIMAEYIYYYENLIKEQGLDVLNVKIPREVFNDILDSIGTMLNEHARKMASEDGAVKDFLNANPMPPNMKELLPDEFRAFSLLLNSLKQWVSAESQSTDRFLLGGTARYTCKSAVDKCILTGEKLGDKPELHHPLRDGRPPILLSKKGHDLIEHNNQRNSYESIEIGDIDEDIWNSIMQIRTKKNQSWAQLREGCNAILTGNYSCRPGAKSFANVVIRDIGLSSNYILEMLNKKGLGL